MNKIYAFSKYIFYSVGGAEKSMHVILNKKSEEGNEIVVIGVPEIKSFNSNSFKMQLNTKWKRLEIKFIFQFNRFFYLEYFLNRSAVKSYFLKLEADGELLTYGMYASIAAMSYKGNSTIYLRSESDIGYNENYYTGIKKILKSFFVLLEYPFYKLYLNDLKAGYKKSKLIFNSKWMSDQCGQKFQTSGSIEYPDINVAELKRKYESTKVMADQGVVFIGDSEVKGLSIVLAIAKKMPNTCFYIFSRQVNIKRIENNVIYMPWSIDNVIPFLYAKLVIVPSLWMEAYGRVSAEAICLGIPVLVSNRGGLPESVNNDKDKIINDYKNADCWVDAIRKVM